MLVTAPKPPARELPPEPPDTWCERSENGQHHWVYARVTGTPTQAAGHLHTCTLCDAQNEQPTEKLSRAWPPRCRRCGSPKFRPNCEVCWEIDITSYPIEPDDIEDAPAQEPADVPHP